ncbi:MAG: hypothetical protein HQL17_05135 [Candidatus Omnitrophica bacterium]|nr:hypothetical protein [Candidatus Omnitrophota bacterium]
MTPGLRMKPSLTIGRGDIVLGLLPELGGRIISLAFRGEELLYAPEAMVFSDIASIPDLAVFKQTAGFNVYGGDKTWVAPEWEWGQKIPPLDLDAGVYTLEHKDGVVVMTSPVCRETGLQVIRRVGFSERGDIFLIETLRNMSAHTITKGIWNVTQIRRPFDVYLPAGKDDVRSYHYEDQTLPDPELEIYCQNDWSTIACHGNTCFKFGAMLREGQVAVVKDTPHGPLRWVRAFDIARDKPYAHRSMVEVFNASLYDYGEVEVHSPLTKIEPGAEVTLTQLWCLYLA